MGFEPEQSQSQTESVNEFAEQMKTMLEEAKVALAKSKDNMTWYYNQKRVWTPEYNLGDQVYLNASNIQTTRWSKKLSHRHLGSFTIERKVGNNTYCLHLPQSMKQFHPVFNVVKLTTAPPDPIIGRHLPPPTTPRNCRWQRGVGSGGNPRQQNDEPEATILDKVERHRHQSQHLGTFGTMCTHQNS